MYNEYSFELKPSALGGIGVFATHDIAKGTKVFTLDFAIRIKMVEEIPPPLRKFCIYINAQEALCPAHFGRLELGWFVNHSFDPNIRANNALKSFDGMSKEEIITYFKSRENYAIKDIKNGEEIVIDYGSLGEPEAMKEDYYR